jgi:hypothetical protein
MWLQHARVQSESEKAPAEPVTQQLRYRLTPSKYTVPVQKSGSAERLQDLRRLICTRSGEAGAISGAKSIKARSAAGICLQLGYIESESA